MDVYFQAQESSIYVDDGIRIFRQTFVVPCWVAKKACEVMINQDSHVVDVSDSSVTFGVDLRSDLEMLDFKRCVNTAWNMFLSELEVSADNLTVIKGEK